MRAPLFAFYPVPADDKYDGTTAGPLEIRPVFKANLSHTGPQNSMKHAALHPCFGGSLQPFRAKLGLCPQLFLLSNTGTYHRYLLLPLSHVSLITQYETSWMKHCSGLPAYSSKEIQQGNEVEFPPQKKGLHFLLYDVSIFIHVLTSPSLLKRETFFFSNLKLQRFRTKPKRRHLPKPTTFLPVSSTARSKPFHDHLCVVGRRWGAFLQEKRKKPIISQPDWPDCRDKATRQVSSLLCNDFLKVVA